MIEVVISPNRIPAGSPAELTIRLTNGGPGPCMNIIFSVRLPAGITRVAGRHRIEADMLSPGEYVTSSLRVLASSQGHYELTSPNFSYRDHHGRAQRVRDFAAGIIVGPGRPPAADPRLDIELRTRDLPLDEWNILRGRVSNLGETDVDRLEVALAGHVIVDERTGRFPLEGLPAGHWADATFFVRTHERGAHVPVHFDLDYHSPNGRHHHTVTRTVRVAPGPATDRRAAPGSLRPGTKILVIAANPRNTDRLRVDEEIREIQQAVREGTERANIDVEIRLAARDRDINQALRQIKPRFVHFAGHGGGEEGSFFDEDGSGRSHSIAVDGLVRLFRTAGQTVECAVVNACDTARLARGLSSVVPYVVGMRHPVGDRSAIAFSTGFYQALADGGPVEQAFDSGMNLMMMGGGEPQPPLFLGAGRGKLAGKRPEVGTYPLWAAIAWEDDDPPGHGTRWTVMRVLREREHLLREEATDAHQPLARADEVTRWMAPVVDRKEYEDQLAPHSPDGPTVLAFLFAPPDSAAIAALDARGAYFDVRTADIWDLFFPGYYRSTQGAEAECRAGARPAGHDYASNWYFSPGSFNRLRQQIEESSGHLWEYSGGTDLVLVNAWLPERGELTIDWASTFSGQITDQMTLGNVIEKMSRDLESGAEDSHYGVGDIIGQRQTPGSHIGRDFMIQALSGIAAALGAKALGT
jgi:hypothetical protein